MLQDVWRQPVVLYLAAMLFVGLAFYLGMTVLSLEYLLVAFVGLCVFAFVIWIAARSFFEVILLVFAISLIMPLASRFGPDGMTALQSFGKLGILGIGLTMWAGKFFMGRPPLQLSQPMRWFLMAWFVSLLLFLFRAIADLLSGVEPGHVSNLFALYSFAYITLTVVMYDQTKDLKWIVRFLWLLALCGIPVAAFGIFQWLVGPEALQSLGMKNITDFQDFGYYTYSGMSLFRVFSTLGAAPDFAAFMVLTIVAVMTLYWLGRVGWMATVGMVGVMGLALLVSFYVTGVVMLGTIVALGWWMSTRIHRVSAQRRQIGIRFSRQTILLLLLMFALASMVLLNEEIRFRIVTSFTLGEENPSLQSRFNILGNTLKFIFAHPLGSDQAALLPYGVTSDVYLTYLVAIGGIPTFVFYVWLYVLPVWFGWLGLRILRQSDSSLYVFYCFLYAWIAVGATLGLFTNSPITTTNPSNLLYWCGMGVMFKIPVLVSQSSQTQLAEGSQSPGLLLNLHQPDSLSVGLRNGGTG